MSGAPTPHMPVSATTSFPATGAATPALPQQSSTPSLPPPSTFDVLPDLHKILSRLLQVSPPAPNPGGAATPGQPSADGPLEIEQVASATAEVKLKLQRAQKAVMALPDIERTCEDQQDEIAHLEARIESLRASLRRLGQPTADQPDGQDDGDQNCDHAGGGPMSSIMDELFKELGEES